VHTNSARGFNDRIRRTVLGLLCHLSPYLPFSTSTILAFVGGSTSSRAKTLSHAQWTAGDLDPMGAETAGVGVPGGVLLRSWTRDALDPAVTSTFTRKWLCLADPPA
jgi:hypothetical protein